MRRRIKVRKAIACIAASTAVAAIQPANAQSRFSSMTVLGDSYADTGRLSQLFQNEAQNNPALRPYVAALQSILVNGRVSNGTNYIDTLQRIYGLSNTKVNNYAVAGARSDETNSTSGGVFGNARFPGLTQQRQEFLGGGQRFGASDLAVVHVGGNDAIGFLRSEYGPATTAEAATNIGLRRGPVVGDTVGELVRAGARTVVVSAPVGQPLFQPSQLVAYPAGSVALMPAFIQGFQDAAVASLVPYARTGTRIVFFDDNLFARSVIANPAAYGFANVTGSCLATPSCATGTDAVKNRYFSYDGLHLTSAGFDQLGRAIANVLAAPETLAPQGDVAQVTATSFAGALFARLDAMREYNAVRSVEAAYSADLPGRAPPRSIIAIPTPNPVSVYIQALHGSGDRRARTGAQAFGYDSIGGILGAEYRPAPGLLFGLAFNYADTAATLRGGTGRFDVATYQFAGYGSYTGPNLFADVVVSYGRNAFSITRPGLAEPLSGRTNGDSLTAGGKAGYLFDLGAVRLGPIVSLNYVSTRNDAYTERGEPFLALTVGRQSVDTLTGGAGVQIRAPFAIGLGALSPYVNVTAEHDVLGGRRALTVGQAVAPSLAGSWQVAQGGERTYGKIVGGVSADLGSALTLLVNAGATFARAGGNDIGVSGGVNYRF